MTLKPLIATCFALLCAQAASAQSAPPAGYVTLDAYQPRAGAADARKSHRFEAVRGASLRQTLEQWAHEAGWQPVSWQLPEDVDFTLGAGARFEGDFVTALRGFINALSPEANLRVRFVQANRLVVVEPLQ